MERIEFQQQCQLMSIDVGFGDAEKFAKGMMLGLSRLEFMMAGQMKLMEAVERSLVDYHQKQNATYAEYVMKEKEKVENWMGNSMCFRGRWINSKSWCLRFRLRLIR